jgi:hypothetical protein
MSDVLRITTLNARSIIGRGRVRQLKAFMKSIHPDVKKGRRKICQPKTLKQRNHPNIMLFQEGAGEAFPEYHTLANPPVRASTGTLVMGRHMPNLHIPSHAVVHEGFAQMVMSVAGA